MWEKFRGVITFFVMDSWEHLMDFLLYRDDYEEMRPVKISKQSNCRENTQIQRSMSRAC